MEFDRAYITTDLEAMKRNFIAAGVPEEAVEAAIQAGKDDETYLSRCGTYQVALDRKPWHGFGEDVQIIHLSIKRIDRDPIHDWRDLQEIKNALVGPENEAIEIYPAESRLVDSANQYHLWVFANPETRIPVGWNERYVTDTYVPNTKQRAFKK
jgi:hypothetical protein